MADAVVKRVRTRHFQNAKDQGIPITGLTSYDMLTARIFDQAGIDFLLVGDSAGNNVFGYDTTLPVTIDQLIPLTRAVAGAVKRAFVVGDMPFGLLRDRTGRGAAHGLPFHEGDRRPRRQARGRGAQRRADPADRVGRHPGHGAHRFTPQSEHQLGGHVIQGRGDRAEQVLADAHAVEDAGAFAVVLEMVPAAVAKRVTEELKIPTISVGAGPHTTGQLLVWTDWAGLTQGRIPSFVKRYANLSQVLTDAAKSYIADVNSGEYPGEQYSFTE